MPAVKESLLRLRVMHAVFLSTWFLFLFVVHVLKPVERPVSLFLIGALALAACNIIVIGLSWRARQIAPALQTLRTKPEDADALLRWRSATIVSFTFAETVTLFGLALKVTGAGWKIAGAFFAVGLLLLVAWAPRLDVPSQ